MEYLQNKMEDDLIDEQGLSFTFGFEFEDEVIDNSFAQAPPDNQSNSTAWNESHENAEQGSSTGSNPPVSIFGQNLSRTSNINNVGHSYLSLEIDPLIALPSPSSVNSDSTIIGTTQANNPTAEISSGLQPPTQENHQPQLDQENTNPSVPRQPNIGQHSTKQLFINSLNNFSPFVTTSFSTPFLASSQPYFPTLDHVELESSSGSNKSTPSHLGSRANEPWLANAPYLTHSKSTFFPSPFSGVAQNPIDDEVEIFLENHEALSHQFNILSGNSLQNESLQYNNNQQAIPYQSSFPINSTGLEMGSRRSHINQLPRSCLYSYHSPPYAPLNPLRSQHLANQQQLLNQVLKNVFNVSQYQDPMMHGNSIIDRPQCLPYQLDQVPLASDLQNSRVLSLPILRAPTCHQQQLNHAVVKPNIPIMPISDPMPMPRSDKELNHPNQQLISRQVMPNLFDSQIGLPSQPSKFQRSQILEQQGFFNQITRPSVAYPSLKGSQLSQVLSSTEQEISGNNPSVMTLSELKMSLEKPKKPTFHRPRRRSRFEVNESSSVPKRRKRDLIGQESGPQASFSQAKDSGRHSHSNVSRSKIYDRLFERAGLPIDPHLRYLAKLN